MDTFKDDRTLRIEIRPGGLADSDTNDSPRSNGSVARRAEGDPTSEPYSARATFVSAEQVMRLISGRNVELLRLIKERKPQSLAELSRISGRPTASLTRTLQRLSALGIVRMECRKGREKVPVVACDRLRFDLPLTF